jgi:glyoxalase family protein
MNFPIKGLHHVTATVNDSQEDLNFYTQFLGLRLVKKTVNFDNNQVYHFYYGTEKGDPGTIMTTFPYRDQGVRQGTQGSGQVTSTAFSVPAHSLDYWEHRLHYFNIPLQQSGQRMGQELLQFHDPSGLVIELVGDQDDERLPWTQADVPPRYAIRGLHSVTLSQRDPEATLRLMTEVFNFQQTAVSGNRICLEVNGGGAGKRIDILVEPHREKGKNGIGTVHHVALAVENDAIHGALHDYLKTQGYKVTDIKDRKYFRSVYFREPGGVLIEVATVSPGFLTDETYEELGQALKLPNWEEVKRGEIEQALPEIIY